MTVTADMNLRRFAEIGVLQYEFGQTQKRNVNNKLNLNLSDTQYEK
jgi:hypothetical protein